MANNTQRAIVESSEITFPNYYPRGVPPRECKDAEGEFFRIVKSKPPSSGCFKNMYETNRKRMQKFQGMPLKCCYGVSVYTEETSLINAFNKFPEGSGLHYIAKGMVEHDDGKMLKTGAPDSTHYTLWLREGNETHTKFACIRELIK